MREFFKPWRRQIGMLTLLMACVFAVGWVRSFASKDIVQVSTGRSSAGTLVSDFGTLAWTTTDELDSNNILGFPAWITLESSCPVHPYIDPEIKAHWPWYEFGYIGDESQRMKFWFFPYWSITIPLTVLSAFLLLSKPHTSNQKKSPEPVPNEGGT